MRWIDISAGVAQLAQGVAAAVLVGVKKDRPNRTVVMPNGTKKLFDFATLLPVAPLLSAVQHFITALVPAYTRFCETTNTNPARWAEYSLSANVMTLLIALLSDVEQLQSLLTLVILNFPLQAIGYMIEESLAPRRNSCSNAKSIKWMFAIGWLIFAAIWTQILISFFGAVDT